MFGSVHPSICLSICLFVCLSIGAQNGWAFKMVIVLTGCAIAVEHTFNLNQLFFLEFLLGLPPPPDIFMIFLDCFRNHINHMQMTPISPIVTLPRIPRN